MSIITDPYKTLKDHALKLWDTKDFANRLAFNNTSWFLSLVWCFMAVTILHLFIVIAVGDVLILADFYSDAWYIGLVTDVFYSTTYIQIALIFFIISPKVVKAEILIWKAYANKEKGFFEWLEFKIKRRFPKFKTTKQRERERLAKPKTESKFQKWIKKRNPVERRLIRVSIWLCWGMAMGTLFIFMFNIDELIFDNQIQQSVQEVADEMVEGIPPTRPDGYPPPTIFDVFISKPDTVLP